MASIARILSDEIQRLVEKEAKSRVRDLKKEVAELRRLVAQQGKRIKSLEKGKGPGTTEKASTTAKAVPASQPTASASDRIRPSSRMIRNLRAKLGLTQAELAQLIGVSGQSIYQWERKDGPLTLRQRTRRALIEVRGMGVREARKRLEETA